MTHEPDDRFDGPAKLAGQNRIRLVAIGFSIAFLAISAQLANLTIYKGMGVEDDVLADHQPRTRLLDRPLNTAAEFCARQAWQQGGASSFA